MKNLFIEFEINTLNEYYANNLEVEVDNFIPSKNINTFLFHQE